MLKCPRCGARVKGPDLLTGVCSACKQRLSESIGDSSEFLEADKTFVSDPDVISGAAGSSLESDLPSSAAASSQADVLDGSVGGSFDLGLTPAIGADGVDDRDTIDSVGSAASGDSASMSGDMKTFVSDQWVESASESSPSSGASETGTLDDGRSIPGPSQDSLDEGGRTYVSEEFAGGDPEANLMTVGGHFEGDAGIDRTFVSDVDESAPPDRTLVVNDSAAMDSGNDRTFVSDDVPEALVRTLESNYDVAGSEDQPSRTMKGKEQERLKSPKNTLVIKTKYLRDLKIAATGTSLQEPEYELIKILGEGGMGVVYDARQTSIDRNVALKMIKGAAAKSDKQQAKFLAEAVVTGDLDHPNIVPIYDVGRNELGALFYSMKKVQGTPWDDVIEQKTLAENLDILMRVADAVAFAHARGVVHRDLKPENTMLGEFGEVLVMDWGLAQPSKRFRKSSSITETSSMGGTPAYMAPEMATGPLEKISHLSDVYLLGAMLYEILTGKPPHTGKNAMKCLMAAARNEITTTEKSGELIDIALKAMATDPVDRFQDVRAFQAAIREYQSHSESILLSSRAEDDLADAQKSDEYQHYAKSLFGFQEAYELWPGNRRAEVGLAEAQFAYADSARRKGDFDLGLSLLTSTLNHHQALRQQLLADKQERETRKTRLAALRKMAFGLVGLVFTTVTIAFFWISYEADKARKAEQVALHEKSQADEAREKADQARAKEEVAKQDALKSADFAEQKRKEAVAAQEQETVARREAVAARDLAEEKRKEAEAARKLEEIAKRKEEYEAYIAQIGLAAAKINENAFESARVLLDACKPELRNWEWGRLMHLCSQSVQTIAAKSPLDALALSPDGTRCATGGWDGTARLWDMASGKLLHEYAHGGLYVHAVAFSPDGRWLATGSDDPAGFVQLWNLETQQREAVFKGHTDAVLSVAFSHSGAQLLSSSYDTTVRLWDASTRAELKTFKGHTWWVWQAIFSADDERIVSVGQDGTALVWNVRSGEHSPPFTGHNGPVYCVTFANDDRTVVTGGYDRRVLSWKTDSLKPYEFRKLEQGESVKPATPFVELGQHATSVRCLAVSTDHALLLSGSQDNTVKLWDLTNGAVVQTFRGHDSWVRGVAFGQDGKSLISASQDATIRTWSIAGYAELRAIQGRELDGHSDAVLAAAFSPDQKLIVTASRDRTARTWNALTGQEQQTFSEGHAFLASTAHFYLQGRRLATAAVDNTARLWDVATGTEVARLANTGRAAALDISSDERWIVTGGDQRQAQVWEAATFQRTRELTGHAAEVTTVVIHPNSQVCLTGDAKGHVYLWSLADGKKLHEMKGHTRRISSAAFTPDGQRVLTGSSDNTVAQWDTATGQELTDQILKHPDSVLTMLLTPKADVLVTSCSDRRIRFWNLATREVQKTLGPFSEAVHSLSISGDGARLLTTLSESRLVQQWDIASGEELRLPQPNGELGPVLDLKRTGGLVWSAIYAPGNDILTVGGNDARLWNLKTGKERITFSPHATVATAMFSPDGRWIVTGSWDNSAKIWNAETGSAVMKLSGGHQGFVNSASFSPDGKQVLTASDDGTAKLWDLEWGDAPSAKVVRTFAGHADRVRWATFSPDGQQIVTTSDDKTARLWNIATGELIKEFRGHAWSVLSADFSKDGKRLVTGSEDNLAKIWNVETGTCDLTLAGHTAPVASVAFAPDGARVLTGSRDQAAKLWDAKTGKEVLTLTRHVDDVTSVHFSPDGRQILTSSRDGTAVIWLTIDWHAQAVSPKVAQRP